MDGESSRVLILAQCLHLWVWDGETKQLKMTGLDSSSSTLGKMLSLMPERLDFPSFLTYLTAHTSLLSSREQIAEAFTAFDKKDEGFIDYTELKLELMQKGPSRMTEEQIHAILGSFIEKVGKHKGKVSYIRVLDAMMGDRKRQGEGMKAN